MKDKTSFDETVFRSPGSEYRGAPFWAWTGRSGKDIMAEQIAEFRDMGFGGFFMHSRVGLDVEYLGEEFMEDVVFCRDKAEELGLRAFLYDEDKWPSGFGGGRVTEDETYASRYLLLSPEKISGGHISRIPKYHTRLTDSGTVIFLKKFEITLSDGRLVSYRETSDGVENQDTWYLYLVISDCLDWFNGRQYADLLNRETARRFLSCTYERYESVLGESFGKSVPAIFHDEPSFKRYETLSDATAREAVGFPYSEDLEKTYLLRYGERFLDRVPELVFERADGAPATVRYRYFAVCSELFCDGFLGVIGQWCDEHHIAFTGHLQDENSLELQAKACGDVMRAMSKLTMPGVDILFDAHEYFTLKQAQSLGRQLGRETAAELYGGTNWDFTLAEHKHEGDWVTALGNTLRVPHLSWMSMKGEMKRDFPASLNHCIPWHRKYTLIEDHFARLSYVLLRGTPLTKVAVVNPVESMWMLLGPDSQLKEQRDALEDSFQNILEELLFHQLDFDLISEAMLPEYGSVKNGRLYVGEASYEAVVMPDLTCMRKTTAELLDVFQQSGGRLIATKGLPAYVDGEADENGALSFLQEAEHIAAEPGALTETLEAYRNIWIIGAEGLISLYQRDRDDARWLFLAHGTRSDAEYEDIEICVKGIFEPELFDTLTGEISRIPFVISREEDGTEITKIRRRIYAEDSLLIRLTECDEALRGYEMPGEKEQRVCAFAPVAVPEEVLYQLEESNVLVLDMVRFRIDGGPLQGTEEVLRADDQVRDALGLKRRSDAMLQPWLIQSKELPHNVQVEYVFLSETECEARLALEYEKDWEITFNGEAIIPTPDEYYIDRVVPMTGQVHIRKGENLLRADLPYGKCSGLEAAYVLGQFGVKLKDDGLRPVITKAPERLSFTSVTEQGLAFYGGNLTYDFTITTKLPQVRAALPGLRGSMAEICLDDESKDVFLTPFEAVFSDVPAGLHRVRIKVYGNRINTLGQLHNCSGVRWSFGTYSCRTEGDEWTYGYRLADFGLIKAPQITESE